MNIEYELYRLGEENTQLLKRIDNLEEQVYYLMDIIENHVIRTDRIKIVEEKK